MVLSKEVRLLLHIYFFETEPGINHVWLTHFACYFIFLLMHFTSEQVTAGLLSEMHPTEILTTNPPLSKFSSNVPSLNRLDGQFRMETYIRSSLMLFVVLLA